MPSLISADTVITEEIALEIIHNYMKENYNYAENEFTIGNMALEDNKVAFSLIIKDHPSDEDGMFIGIVNSKGKIEVVQEPQKIDIQRQLENDLKASYFKLEDMNSFKQKWAPILDNMEKEGRHQEVANIFSNYVAMTRLNIGLPTQTDISKEDALSKAKEYLSSSFDWTQETVEYYIVIIELYYTPEQINKPVYHFLLSRHSLMQPEYLGSAGENAYNKYEKALFDAFGGESRSTPFYISIMIDAQTGELIEEPIVSYPPVENHYLDYFLK